MKLDKKKVYLRGPIEYTYIAHDEGQIIMRGPEGKLCVFSNDVVFTIKMDPEHVRITHVNRILRLKRNTFNWENLVALLAKHDFKIVNKDPGPVTVYTQCCCTGCTNKATRTQGGHPICNACK